MSAAERQNFGTITPAAAFFKGIGGVAFGLMLPVLAGFIAEAIADRPGLALGFVGGMIAAGGKSGFLGALAAGFIAGYFEKKNYEYAFHKGLAAGSASAFSEQLATKEEVEALLRKLEGR